MFRPAFNYLAPGGIVLGYHRVSDATWDPLNLAISRKKFRNHLEIISGNFNLVSLASLLAMKERGEPLKGIVSITFDDGCEDFFHYAVPELLSRNIPATIFITTGYSGEKFWWDEVSDLMSRGCRDKDKMAIEFHVNGGKRVFSNLADEKSAGVAVREICDQLLKLEPSRRSQVIGQIRRQTDKDRTSTSTPRAMTQKQLQELSEIPLVEIGAHSVTHPLLSQLSEAEQVSEIQDSKSVLEALGRTVRGFSYPNGSYSHQTRDLVKSCGFDYACTSRQAAVRRRSDNYQLPRIWAPNVDGEGFHRWISAWSGLRS
jgi:peptidoglycan/xylan/chitin deacetylase (PgdA/CDA1 family)